MREFAVAADGHMTDRTVQTVIEHCRKEVPTADEPAIEAHMTLARPQRLRRHAYPGLQRSAFDTRFNMLRWLYHSPGNKRSITELGAYLDASAPNVTRMVKALEEAKWVRRVSSPGDRRVVLVELTEKGKEDFAAIMPRALDIWSEVWSGLSLQEKATLSHVLAKLRLSLLSRYIGPEGYFLSCSNASTAPADAPAPKRTNRRSIRSPRRTGAVRRLSTWGRSALCLDAPGKLGG
jgi:DNA-binding MarR family transcriptional regulator